MFTETHSPMLTVAASALGERECAPQQPVGEGRLSSSLTPAQTEAAIRRALALAAALETRAQHARRLVAQLKGETQ